ncbi:hypothetical protein GCM10009606_20800 [Nocardioides aquiterrae]|uniref:Uncharacterized protein n=1 Tax=Nocardioides aquiterrae TaxID=203799 RepID=A0ABP4F0T6_9ACTN
MLGPVIPMTHAAHHADSPDPVRRAWWSLLLFLVSFVAAFVVGEGLVTLYGYDSTDADVPGWVLLAAGLPACLVFAAPLLLTWRLARRAGPAGRAPLLVGAVVVGVFLAQNLLGLLAQVALG